MTELYEYINDSKNAVTDWTDTTTETLFWMGLILNERKLEDMDTLIETWEAASSWTYVALAKRQCEFLGYNSVRVDDCVKEFLTNMPMFTNYKVPKVDSGNNWFTIGHPSIHGCRWSKELNYETSRWDAEDCFDGIHAVTANESDAWYRGNPDTPDGEQLMDGRIYEKDQLACTYWDLMEAGVVDAETDFQLMWTYLQNHWDHFSLAPPARYDYGLQAGTDGWVWDTPEILEVFGRYQAATGVSLSNWDRVLQHVGPGYVDSGYGSRHWIIDGGTQYEAVVHHNDANAEVRMKGTFLAYVLLHQMYDDLSTTQQTTFKNMLQGSGHTQAYLALIDATAGLYNAGSKKFKMDSTDGAVSDHGTSYGAVLMFLLGICPGTRGRLAIPLRSQKLGLPFMVDAAHFRWDEDNRRIRIPVFAGDLTFMYGSSNVDYTFPRTGVYHVYFNTDYTEIIRVVQIGDLPGRYYYSWPANTQLAWSQSKRGWKAAHVLTTITRRHLVLTYRDGATGWFDKEYVEYDYDGVAVPAGASSTVTGAGLYSAAELDVFTGEPVCQADQLLINNRIYEVDRVEEQIKNDEVICYRSRVHQQPLTTVT